MRKDDQRVKKFVEMATIVENTAIIPEVWKMVFKAPKTAREAKAGQFVNVHRDGGQTFLRRPFGIVDADIDADFIPVFFFKSVQGGQIRGKIQLKVILTEG